MKGTVTVTVNGQSLEVESPLTVEGMLRQLGFEGKPVVVEHNRLALLPREHADTALHDGDVVELIQITAGG